MSSRNERGASGLVERVRFLGRGRTFPDLSGVGPAGDEFGVGGFPYVVVEALASGLPIVATDVGGVREGVLDGGTGRLVKPATPMRCGPR